MGELRVFAECVGNPDFQQYAPVGPDLRVVVPDEQQAVREFLKWIEMWHLGGGNVCNSRIVNDQGQEVYRISYNGRLWPPGPWKSGQLALREPTKEDFEWARTEAGRELERLVAAERATEKKARKAPRRRRA